MGYRVAQNRPPEDAYFFRKSEIRRSNVGQQEHGRAPPEEDGADRKDVFYKEGCTLGVDDDARGSALFLDLF